MNPHTDTPRTDAFVAENSLLAYSDDKYELTIVHARQLERELAASHAEVERLKEMVMEAARKGDELLEPFRLRAEKAETLIKQIHAFVEALNQDNK